MGGGGQRRGNIVGEYYIIILQNFDSNPSFLPRVVLAKHSLVLQALIENKSEIYMDEFTECLEGLYDAIDMLYGAEVVVTMGNIQALLKFSVMYDVDDVYNLCIGWVKGQLTMDNLYTFLKLGVFIEITLLKYKHHVADDIKDDIEDDKEDNVDDDEEDDIKDDGEDDGEVEKEDDEEDDKEDNEEDNVKDVLTTCDDFILKRTAEDLLKVSKTWPDDEDVMLTLVDASTLSITLPTVTNWISSEKQVIDVLNEIEGRELPVQVWMENQDEALKMIVKMSDICSTLDTSKRITKLLEVVFVAKQNCSPTHELNFEIQTGSQAILQSLKPKLWRNFDVDQMCSLHYYFKITDFFFAEILLDWISFKKPPQNTFDQLWGIVSGSRVSNDYITALGNSVKTHCSKLVIPMPEDADRDAYSNCTFDNSDMIVARLGSNTLTEKLVTFVFDNCIVRGCGNSSKLLATLQLSDTIPWYQLGMKGCQHVNGDYHHDKIKHWYATEEKKGKRVLISFVTNSLSKLLEKVNRSKDIEIYFFY